MFYSLQCSRLSESVQALQAGIESALVLTNPSLGHWTRTYSRRALLSPISRVLGNFGARALVDEPRHEDSWCNRELHALEDRSGPFSSSSSGLRPSLVKIGCPSGCRSGCRFGCRYGCRFGCRYGFLQPKLRGTQSGTSIYPSG